MTNAATKPKQGQVVEISSPYSLIQSAVASGATVETLEKLMALAERHDANVARKAFYEAMQQFQGIKPELKRSSNVNFSSNKGTTNYNFCALPDIDKALRKPLDECGLSYRFENFVEGGLIGIRCIVSHVSGHSESTQMIAPVDATGNKNSIQQIGSTSTYLQRYTMIAAFGLTTADEDDDGGQNSDLPLLRVLQQNELLRDVNLLKVIVDIKECLASGDYETVVGYMAVMPESTKSAIWLAPTKGGILSTKEISLFKSNEYFAASKAYYDSLPKDEDSSTVEPK